jgi:hypothetical protein
MRTIIAGSRGFADLAVVDQAMWEAQVFAEITPSVILSGTARGADQLGEQWAEIHGVPIEQYPPDWQKYPNAGGFVRNKAMATRADALVAVWNGWSPGTKSMIQIARTQRLKVYVVRISSWLRSVG